MSANKNMDSVFADCSEKDLDFDILFDDDDSIIDLVAGVDESGEYITGKDPEYGEYLYNEDGTAYADGSPLKDDSVEDKDSEDLRDGKEKYNTPGETEGEDTNDVKDNDKEWKVTGGDNSAMDKAHDVTPEIKDAIGEKEEVCKGCGKPMSDCECSLEEFVAMNFSDFDLFSEDTESEVSKYTDTTFEKELSGSKEDTISDKDDEEVRDGKEKYNTPGNTEGDSQDVIGAEYESYLINLALEECDGAECQSPEEALKTSKETVPDCVQTDGSSNNIAPDYSTSDMNDLNEADLINLALESDDTKEDDKKVEDSKDNDTEELDEAQLINLALESDEEDLIVSDDDDDIEMIDKNEDVDVSDIDLSVDLDEDELIDLAMSDDID